MSKSEKFFYAMAWLFFGVVIGFFVSPIKKGIDITIASHNSGSDALAFYGGDEEDFDDEME